MINIMQRFRSESVIQFEIIINISDISIFKLAEVPGFSLHLCQLTNFKTISSCVFEFFTQLPLMGREGGII